MPQHVRCGAFLNYCQFSGLLQLSLNRGGMNVVAALALTARIPADCLQGEDVLPGEREFGVRFFLVEGKGQVHGAETAAEIISVDDGSLAVRCFEVLRYGLRQGRRER